MARPECAHPFPPRFFVCCCVVVSFVSCAVAAVRGARFAPSRMCTWGLDKTLQHPGPGANATDIRGIINRLFEDCGRDPLPEALPSYPAPAPSFHDDFGLNDNWLAAPFANGAGAPALSTPPRHHTVQNAAQARPAPTPPPHGGTLRCVCGPRSQWATEFVQCTHCSRYQHLECVTDGAGSAPALSPWVCAHCRLSFFLSQTGSAELLMMPRRVPDWSAMPSPHRVQNPEFTIPHAMYSAVVKDTAACVSLLFVSFVLSDDLTASLRAHAHVYPDVWFVTHAGVPSCWRRCRLILPASVHCSPVM